MESDFFPRPELRVNLKCLSQSVLLNISNLTFEYVKPKHGFWIQEFKETLGWSLNEARGESDGQ